MLDTYGGQSGSPTWIFAEDRRYPGSYRHYVVGVRGYGGCPNSCIRVQYPVAKMWNYWASLHLNQ